MHLCNHQIQLLAILRRPLSKAEGVILRCPPPHFDALQAGSLYALKGHMVGFLEQRPFLDVSSWRRQHLGNHPLEPPLGVAFWLHSH